VEDREILNKLLDHAEETKDSISNLDKKLDLHIQKSEYELKQIHETDKRQNVILEEHVQGVTTLKEMHRLQKKEFSVRFEKLEAPRKWVKTTAKYLIGLGSIVGTAYAIVKLFMGEF